jgi:hypothetical protein
MGTTKSEEDISGADPLVRAGPLDPLFRLRQFPYQADEGVGRGPGGPPHLRLQRSATTTAASVTLLACRGPEPTLISLFPCDCFL